MATVSIPTVAKLMATTVGIRIDAHQARC